MGFLFILRYFLSDHYYKIKQVGMVVQKRTQSRVVGKITDNVHPLPYFQVTGASIK